MPNLDTLFPPPCEVRRRAWECAYRLGAENPATLDDEARWQFLQSVVHAGHGDLTWRQCGALLRLYSLFAERQHQCGLWGWR